MEFYTYILYSKIKDRYYIGFTSDSKERLLRHNQRSKGFTGNTNDWEMIYKESFSSKEMAMVAIEKLISNRNSD